MFRLRFGAVLLVFFVCAGLQQAHAQASPPTPLTKLPTVPHTLPVIGGDPFPADASRVAIASATNKPDDVTMLVANGNSPDDADKQGRTGLIYAAISNYVGVAQTLLSHGAKINLRDNFGYTALHWAAERGSIEVMRLLLAAAALVNVQDQQGVTPLMLAAQNGNVGAVRLLLQNHADPTVRDYTGRDAAGWAMNRPAVVQLLSRASVVQ